MRFNFGGKSLLASLLLLSLYAFQITSSRILQELSMNGRHEQWMAKHGRVYKDELEKDRRFQIFKENVEFIQSMNAGNRPYKLGLNEFADLSNEEFRAYYMGFKTSNFQPKSSQEITTFKYQNVTEVPESIDWREKGAVNGVKNQNPCGCCWAFSAVAAVEGINQIKNGQLVSLSEQQLVDCDKSNHGCRGGFMDRAFQYIIENKGLFTESDYPYEAQDGACKNINASPAVTITRYGMVPENDEASLLNAVANQPVSVGIDGYEQVFQHYQSGVFDGENCGNRLNHAVTIVGYGTSEDGKKYWLIKNSWGTTWGEEGYMRLERGVATTIGGLCGINKAASYPIA